MVLRALQAPLGPLEPVWPWEAAARAPLDPPDPQDRTGLLDSRARQAHRADLDLQEPEERGGMEETWVFPERWGRRQTRSLLGTFSPAWCLTLALQKVTVPRVPRAVLVWRAEQGRGAWQGCRDPWGLLGLLDLQDPRDRQDHPTGWASTTWKDPESFQDRQDYLDPRVHRVLQAFREDLVSQGSPGRRGARVREGGTGLLD